jgi:glycosyltransferase involved in cell wall biosynthesis
VTGVRISVIIPAFDAAGFLRETVASVAAQQLDGLEVVIVNDASRDATADVARSLIDEYDGRLAIRYGEHAQNRGGGAARNTCLELAQGEYIFNLDADNLLVPGLLRELLDAADTALAESGDHAMVSPATLQYFRDARRRVLGVELPGRSRRILMHAWKYSRLSYEDVMTHPETPASSGNYLYHRSIADAVGGHFEDCGAYDAWSFGVRCYDAGYRYVTVPGTSYLHRLHAQSYWTRNQNTGANRENLFRALSHFPAVYSARTFELLDPANPNYPDDPFSVVELAKTTPIDAR